MKASASPTLAAKNVLSTIFLLTNCAVAAAQDAPPADQVPDPATETHITFSPGVLVTRLSGDSTLGPGPGAQSININDDFNLDVSEAAFNAELSIVKGDRWQLDFNGLAFSTENSGVFAGTSAFGSLQLNPGDAFDASFDITSVAGEATYWLHQPFHMGTAEDGTKSDINLKFGPSAGVRYVDVNQKLTITGEGRETTGGEWLAPFGGFRMQLQYKTPDSFPLLRAIQIDGAFGIGPALGGDGGIITHLRAGVTFMFSDNFGMTFGYRLLQMDVENDDYEFDGGLQGLFFGGTVRF